MDSSDHASSDIKNLADSLRGKFETLYPLSQECCIYRVPQEIRRLNPRAYTPQVVSIGPIHHGKEELKAMEEHKLRYLQHFLERTQVSIENFLALIKSKEENLRNCYAEIIELNSDDFVMMILVDAIFLIEYCLRGSKRNLISKDDRLFRKPWIDVRWDLWLVENQIPLFILKDLFNLVYADHHHRLSFITITRWLWKDVLYYFPIEDNLSELYFSKAAHFLDLLRLCLHHPSQSPARNKLQPQNIPTLTELHQSGVKFKLRSSKNLFDIKFKKGILEIPFLTIYVPTELFFRNLQAFEILHCLYDNCYMNDYITIMNHLVNTTKDVELLVQNGVVENWLWNYEAVSTLFHNLARSAPIFIDNFQYADLIEDLKAYCKSPRHKWKATLKQNYFYSPWASISVVAAVVLLLLTFIQAVCSIIAL